MSDHRSCWSNILSLEATKSLKRPGEEYEFQMTSTKSLLSFQLFAHQGLSDPEVTASSSPQNYCWLLNTYTQACPGLLRHPFSPAHLGQCLLSWALCFPHPNTSVIHANGLAPLAQPALRSRGTSPTLHAGGGGER